LVIGVFDARGLQRASTKPKPGEDSQADAGTRTPDPSLRGRSHGRLGQAARGFRRKSDEPYQQPYRSSVLIVGSGDCLEGFTVTTPP
jgi:hypothetical protein